MEKFHQAKAIGEDTICTRHHSLQSFSAASKAFILACKLEFEAIARTPTRIIILELSTRTKPAPL